MWTVLIWTFLAWCQVVAWVFWVVVYRSKSKGVHQQVSWYVHLLDFFFYTHHNHKGNPWISMTFSVICNCCIKFKNFKIIHKEQCLADEISWAYVEKIIFTTLKNVHDLILLIYEIVSHSIYFLVWNNSIPWYFKMFHEHENPGLKVMGLFKFVQG